LPAVAALILMSYNQARFDSVWESGYRYQMLCTTSLEIMRGYGIFNPVHLAGNLYHFLLAQPLPVLKDGISQVLKFPYLKADPWGMSIFITSPYFIYLFWIKYKDKLAKMLIGAAFLTGLPIFFYYGIGAMQYGYRYSLDFLPLLYILLMIKYKEKNNELSRKFKLVLLTSAVINLFFFTSLG
jgi:hypothetical protein